MRVSLFWLPILRKPSLKYLPEFIGLVYRKERIYVLKYLPGFENLTGELKSLQDDKILNE